MKLNAIFDFLRTHRQVLDACFMAFSGVLSGILTFSVYGAVPVWVVLCSFLLMFMAGYRAKPYLDPYLRIASRYLRKCLAPIKRWYGSALDGWLSSPNSTLNRQHSKETDPYKNP